MNTICKGHTLNITVKTNKLSEIKNILVKDNKLPLAELAPVPAGQSDSWKYKYWGTTELPIISNVFVYQDILHLQIKILSLDLLHTKTKLRAIISALEPGADVYVDTI